MFSLFGAIIFPFFVALPGAIGFVFALPIRMFYPLFVRFTLLPQTSKGLSILFGLLTTLIVMSYYAWQIISLEYAITIPSSKDWEFRQKYEDEAVLEAWRRAIIPHPFQKSCYSPKDVVCQLAVGFPLGIWDWRVNADDLPWLSGLIAGITSTISVRSMFRSIEQQANSVSVDSTP